MKNASVWCGPYSLKKLSVIISECSEQRLTLKFQKDSKE